MPTEARTYLRSLGRLRSSLLGRRRGRRGTSFRICVDLEELGADGYSVIFGGEILGDDAGIWGRDVDGDLVSLDPGNDLIGLHEITWPCSRIRKSASFSDKSGKRFSKLTLDEFLDDSL